MSWEGFTKMERTKLGKRVLRAFNAAETGYEKPHPEAYRRVLRTLGDEVEAVRRVIRTGGKEVCVPELCVSHGWRGYRRGLSHPTCVRCLHVQNHRQRRRHDQH